MGTISQLDEPRGYYISAGYSSWVLYPRWKLHDDASALVSRCYTAGNHRLDDKLKGYQQGKTRGSFGRCPQGMLLLRVSFAEQATFHLPSTTSRRTLPCQTGDGHRLITFFTQKCTQSSFQSSFPSLNLI